MPIYEFECNSCSNKFELLIFRLNDTPRCPVCGSDKLRKCMSTFGFTSSGSQGGQKSCSSCRSGNCSSCH